MDNEPKREQLEALERACGQIPAHLHDADLANYDEYEQVEIGLHDEDESDSSDERFTFTKSDGGLTLEYKKYDFWRNLQSKERSVRKTVEKTEENLDLFRLLCKEVYASACFEEPVRSYDDTARKVRLLSKDTVVRSGVITAEMLAVLSRFAKVPDYFISCIDDPAGLQKKGAPTVERRDPPAKEAFRYRFTYASPDEEQTFTVGSNARGYLRFTVRYRKGKTTEAESYECPKSDFERKYPDALDDLRYWSRQPNADNAQAPFSAVDHVPYTQSSGFTKIEKRLLDLINWLSPEDLQIPDALIVDNKNTVYLKIRKSLPAGAFENNLCIRYLRIVAADDGWAPQRPGLFDTAKKPGAYTIGKNAFKNSSLTRVELRPRHFAYNGTGILPAVKEGAFDGCALEDVLLYNGEVYLGDLPDSRNYSMKIGRITKKEDKRKYARRLECYDGIIYQIESRPLRADPAAASVTVPEGRTEIPEKMFCGCPRLARVIVPESIRIINERAFSGCPELKTVCYRGSKEQWKKILICSGNDQLSEAAMIFNYKDEGQT